MSPPPQPSSSRLIHISDVHCTTKDYTYNKNDGAIVAAAVGVALGVPIPADPARGDHQDTRAKCAELVAFLTSTAPALRTSTIVITGDLLDSADEAEAKDLARECLLGPLDAAGFEVILVPGNHDYFRMGNQFTTDRIATGRASWFEAFSTYARVTAPDAYPVDVELGDGNHLILLDSLKDHYDVETGSHKAQGNIGQQQMDWLRTTLPGYQSARSVGRKVAVALHHNPFETEGSLELTDGPEFLDVLAGKVDALLFGHTGPPHEFHTDRSVERAIPVVTSENIEPMSTTGYIVSVIDLDAACVEVHSTSAGLLRVEPSPIGPNAVPVVAPVQSASAASLFGTQAEDVAIVLDVLRV